MLIILNNLVVNVNNLISRFSFLSLLYMLYIIWCNHHRFPPPPASSKSYLVLGKWHLPLLASGRISGYKVTYKFPE